MAVVLVKLLVLVMVVVVFIFVVVMLLVLVWRVCVAAPAELVLEVVACWFGW